MTDAPRGFLRLQDVVLPPPLPGALSVLIVTGLAYLGWRLASRLRRGRPEALDAAAGFIVATAATAVVVHALALAQLSSVAVLRPLGWALAATGAFALVRHRVALVDAARAELADLRSAPRWEQAVVLLSATVLLGLGAAALGPATDADSADYHLGVPLDWLRHGGAYPRFDWLTSRLLGIGESLNLLGLAAGTDGLGAAFQFGGLVAAAVAAAAFAPAARDRRLAWLLVIGCPVVAFLVPSQKPQMLPAAATAVALVLAVRRFERFGPADALLVFGSAAFALSCKISFLLTAGFTILVGLLAARRSGRLLAALGIAAATVAIVWVPLLVRSAVFFGDPISPFLERFSTHPDPKIVEFATYLRDSAGEHSLANVLRLPLTLLGTTHLGALTTPIGLGALAFVPALGMKGPARMLLWAALAAAGTCIVLGQIGTRFFLEPFLWAGASLSVAPWNRTKKVVVAGIVAQSALSAAVALVGAALLFQGALTPGLRDVVMRRSSPGYAEGKWLDELLPKGAVIVAPQGRFPLFLPRPFAMPDVAMGETEPAQGDELLRGLVEQFHINTIVDDGVGPTSPYVRLEKKCGTPMTEAKVFPLATRNPFNALQYASRPFALRGCFPR
jgi:hypothetical protein